jgi:hypothetical protein
MTLILTFLSDEYVILASDRRGTWVDKDGKPLNHEDTNNKAIVLCGHFLMGYTGFTKLDGVQTEQWVCNVLAGLEPGQYFGTLAERSEPAIARVRRETGLKMNDCGQAFVAVGYGSFRDSPDRLQAVGVTVSNAIGDESGGWQPREDFKATRTTPLSGSNDFRIGAFGNTPKKAPLLEAVDLIRRYRKHDISRMLGVCQVLVNLIRETAEKDKDERIGKDISVSVLPRVGVPALDVSIPLAGITDPVVNLTCAFVPSDGNVEHAVAYSPATVCPQTASFGGEVWTTKPPWWRD